MLAAHANPQGTSHSQAKIQPGTAWQLGLLYAVIVVDIFLMTYSDPLPVPDFIWQVLVCRCALGVGMPHARAVAAPGSPCRKGARFSQDCTAKTQRASSIAMPPQATNHIHTLPSATAAASSSLPSWPLCWSSSSSPAQRRWCSWAGEGGATGAFVRPAHVVGASGAPTRNGRTAAS